MNSLFFFSSSNNKSRNFSSKHIHKFRCLCELKPQNILRTLTFSKNVSFNIPNKVHSYKRVCNGTATNKMSMSKLLRCIDIRTRNTLRPFLHFRYISASNFYKEYSSEEKSIYFNLNHILIIKLLKQTYLSSSSFSKVIVRSLYGLM